MGYLTPKEFLSQWMEEGEAAGLASIICYDYSISSGNRLIFNKIARKKRNLSYHPEQIRESFYVLNLDIPFIDDDADAI